MIVEVQTAGAVERVGHSEPSEQQLGSGLFSDCPHLCRTESEWLPDQQVAIQTFNVAEASGGRAQEFRSTTNAWRDADLIGLLRDAGFNEVARRDDWPCNTRDLKLWLARRG